MKPGKLQKWTLANLSVKPQIKLETRKSGSKPANKLVPANKTKIPQINPLAPGQSPAPKPSISRTNGFSADTSPRFSENKH
jgi:hypothetical protein